MKLRSESRHEWTQTNSPCSLPLTCHTSSRNTSSANNEDRGIINGLSYHSAWWTWRHAWMALVYLIMGPLNSKVTHGYFVSRRTHWLALVSCFDFWLSKPFTDLPKLHFQTYFSLLSPLELLTIFQRTPVYLAPWLLNVTSSIKPSLIS